ncbi:TetR family transcriptional regulator [Lactobacillus sp. Sy-1]|uniref:TetR/AcrR family transcriptional regulator n=1 Tax=Lactobacillus sp. Sy-1 TaxID=2109645 RepID=UPI001C5BC71A|nr:TetR family transcriptional regulator [Lactobacillus sp. Sy-1]
MADFRKKRTDLIIFQALNNMLEQDLFSEITVNQIAQNALVHRNTFYHHFEDKYDLLHRFILFTLNNSITGVDRIRFSKQPFHIFHEQYGYNESHKQIFKLQSGDKKFMQIFSSSFEEIFVQGNNDADNIWAMGKISAIMTWNRLNGSRYNMFSDYEFLDHIFETHQFPIIDN